MTARKKLKEYSHLRHVPFSKVEKKVFILTGTSLQEALSPLEVKKGSQMNRFQYDPALARVSFAVPLMLVVNALHPKPCFF